MPPVSRLRDARLVLVTLVAAGAVAFLFRVLHLPLAYILGSLIGAALAANLAGSTGGERLLRRSGQLFVGASVGALLDVHVLDTLVRLFPLMLLVAVAANVLGFLLAIPIAVLSGLDKLTGLLSCLPAGMAEMATLAREVGADEQSVAIIHTLRVIIVLSLVPVWLVAIGHPLQDMPVLPDAGTNLSVLGLLLAISLLVAATATKFGVMNAFVVVPTVACVCFVASGIQVPAVPPPLLIAAQICIGASLGVRFRYDRMRSLPRTAVGGMVSGLVLVSISFFAFGMAIEHLAGLDHLSSLLSAAPGGLGEMIATASALGVSAAAVAGFQLTRSIFTNIIVAPLIRREIVRRQA